MKTINDLREALKSEYVGTSYNCSTAMRVGFSAKDLLEENFKNCGLKSRVFVRDEKQKVCLQVCATNGYTHTFIEIKVKKTRGEYNYRYGGYGWTVSNIEVESWEAEKDESGKYKNVTDLDKIITKVVGYLETINNANTERIKQGADIIEALKKEYNFEHYYDVENLVSFISKNFSTIEKEIEARHPGTKI